MISDILDLIVGHISSVVPDAGCKRAWALRVDANKLDDLEFPSITVVFVKDDKRNITKGDRETVVSAVIIVQKKIDPKNMNDSIDPLVKIMEDLRDDFMSPVMIENDPLIIECGIAGNASEMPLYDTDRLLKRHEFLGTIPIEANVTIERI